MKIEEALELKIGDVVHCPTDRGTLSFSGKVTHQDGKDCKVNKNISGDDYIWVGVDNGKQKSVWPSNRISKN